jgi:hydrogenase nickel incorporation protein HypB
LEIKIVRNVLEKNKKLADDVRDILRTKKRTMFNFMSSPGAGKTLLLEKLIPELLLRNCKVGVIEGDVATLNDSIRLQHTGVPIVQINTEKFGSLCHLGSNVVLAALEQMLDDNIDLVIVENVGNLVCPGEYDTGSDVNIVIVSVTEGEDKPLKYPRIFQKTDLAIINKIDIAEACSTDIGLIKENINKVAPQNPIMEISAKKDIGITKLAEWMLTKHRNILESSNILVTKLDK